jgi:hypothetical protein
MAGAKEHFPRWQPWVLCALRRCRRSARPRCRSGVGRCALAEEGRADASVDLPVARRHGARGAKRADGVRASVGQSRHASDLHPRPSAHVLDAAVAGRRAITYVSQQPGHRDASIATSLGSLAARCVAPRRSARPLQPRNPRATGRGSDDESTERKSFVLNGEPNRNRTHAGTRERTAMHYS